MARRFAIPLSTVQFWVQRAAGHPLEDVAWHDQPSGPRTPANRTAPALEQQIVLLRYELAHESDLGEKGAVAIQRALEAQGVTPVPHVRTIGRILERRGLLDARRPGRRPAPPRGWYLPAVAEGYAELDAWDGVEGLKLKDGPLVEVLNVVSLHGGLVGSWPHAASLHARQVGACLEAHWREVGCPGYAQFDNDTIFQGPHQHPDVVSRVMRTCLSLGVTPVFASPRETGFQAGIEGYNALWQGKVWGRFTHASLEALQEQSARYVQAHRQRTARRQAEAPDRRPFPADWRLDLQVAPQGRLIYLRRTNDVGEAALLGRTFLVDPHWTHRLVRCEVCLDEKVLRCYQLRRRAPDQQPLLREWSYELPARRFRE